MALGWTDVRWFSDVVWRLHACTRESALFEELVRVLHARFRALGTVVEEVSYTMSSFRVHAGIVDFGLPPDYIYGLQDSPMVVRWPDRRGMETMHLSQMASRRSFHRTTYYDLICRPVRLEDQLIGTFPTAPGIALNFSVNRERLFSSEERTLMTQVRRHVQACLAGLRRSAPSDMFTIPLEAKLNAQGRPRGFPVALREVLVYYFPRSRREIASGSLPEEVRRWLEASLNAFVSDSLPRPLSYLRVEGPRGHLVARVFPGSPGGDTTLRFTEELRVVHVLTLRRQGLTARECEILYWLMAGKRDREIAMIVGCSARTTAKHVESLLRKTGTHTRQAAVYTAGQWLRGIASGSRMESPHGSLSGVVK